MNEVAIVTSVASKDSEQFLIRLINHINHCLMMFRQKCDVRDHQVFLYVGLDHFEKPLAWNYISSAVEIRWINNSGKKGQGGCLNTILQSTSADLYCFIDCDCIPGASWLTEIKSSFESTGFDVLTGPYWYHEKGGGVWARYLSSSETCLMKHSARGYYKRGLLTRVDCRNLIISKSFKTKMAALFPLFEEGMASVSYALTEKLRSRIIDDSVHLVTNDELEVYHSTVDSLLSQGAKYYKRGYTGKFHLSYREGFASLGAAFLKKYLWRHFLIPAIRYPFASPYILLVHIYFWLGIVNRQQSQQGSKIA